MNVHTEQTSADLASVATRTGFGLGAVESMLRSIVHGGGRMAQFDHPEFGGFGQWMRGGMPMIGDPGNAALRQRVGQLCDLLADAVRRDETPGLDGPSPRQSSNGSDDVVPPHDPDPAPPPGPAARTWYPATLGMPNSSGAQNGMRYAWFAGSRRLAVDDHGRITVYDTGEHAICGISQQQGVRGTVAFASQHGTVDLATLRVVEGARARDPDPAPADAGSPAAIVDPFQALERLAALHARGIVTDAEFAAKRTELLGRI